MKRDWDLIREILIRAEGIGGDDDYLYASHMEGDRAAIVEHMRLLLEAGLLEGWHDDGYNQAHIRRITWNGHDFLASMRSDTAWEKIKAFATKSGVELSLYVVKEMGKMFVAECLGVR